MWGMFAGKYVFFLFCFLFFVDEFVFVDEAVDAHGFFSVVALVRSKHVVQKNYKMHLLIRNGHIDQSWPKRMNYSITLPPSCLTFFLMFSSRMKWDELWSTKYFTI